MVKDINIIRELAKKYCEIANDDYNTKLIKLHKSVNDLKMIRPVVIIDNLPWNELNIDNQLTLVCKDKIFRGVENFFRKELIRYKYFRTDWIFQNYYSVKKIIHSTGNGINIKEKTLNNNNAAVSSHEYQDQFKTEEDIEKLHNEIITYDETETMKKYNKIKDAIGDIIPIKLEGETTECFCGTWDLISTYRGVTNLLIDLIARPDFTHKLVSKLTNIYIDKLNQYEKLNLLNHDKMYLHCTPALTDDLPEVENGHVKAKNVWGRGFAQILASCSKEMRDEFDIEYMKKTLEPFGLVYYGCCEPLDTMIDIVEKIPNIRKISVTPWANTEVAAEAIGKKYVMALKPNPANVGGKNFDKDVVKKELSALINAAKKNNCSCDIVLKDISTINGNVDNLVQWSKIAMDLVSNY